MIMYSVLILLIIYQIKHFVADYPLQNIYMLGKFKERGWILPLASHCAVHALFTFIIVAFASHSYSLAFGMAFFDFSVHFTMDRIKASPHLLGQYKAINQFEYGFYTDQVVKAKMTGDPVQEMDAKIKLKERMKENSKFWYSLGIDQTIHHLTHYVIIFITMGYL